MLRSIREEVFFLLGVAELAVLLVAGVGAEVLVPAVAQDVASLLRKHLLAGGGAPVAPDAVHDVTGGVDEANVDVGHDLLQGNGFALKAASDLLPRFGMVVENAGLWCICDAPSGGGVALSQFHVLEAGQVFVKAVLVPDAVQQGCVGVVAEKAVLCLGEVLGIVLAEDAAFAELAAGATVLAPIGDFGLAVEQGLAEVLQPMGINGDAVAAGDDENVTIGGLAADVEGATEGEFFATDVADDAAVAFSDLDGAIGGAGVDEDDFVAKTIGLLVGDAGKDGVEMLGLIERADNDTYTGIGKVERGGPNEQAEVGLEPLVDEANFVRVDGVGGEHVPVDGNHLFDADFFGELERLADGHVADDAAAATEEIVLVDRKEGGMDRAFCGEGVEDLLTDKGIAGEINTFAVVVQQVADVAEVAVGVAGDLGVRGGDGADLQARGEFAPVFFGALDTLFGDAPAAEDLNDRLRGEKAGLWGSGCERGDGVWVAVVDVLVGKQYPVGIGDTVRLKGNGSEALKVRGIQLLNGIREVRVQIDGSALKAELAA